MPFLKTFSSYRSKESGSILMLVFFFIILLTLEVAMVNLISTRSLGEEGVYSSRGASAEMALNTAVNRLTDDLYGYLAANGDTTVATDFARGGANDISEVLQAKKPSTGALENTDFTIEAWVEQKRGIWYKISARAIAGDIEQSTHRWVKLNPCLTTSVATLTTILTGRPYPGYQSIVVDSPNERLFFGENNNPGNFYTWKDGVLSTIVSGRNAPGVASTLESSSGAVFFGEEGNPGNFYTWKDNVLTTILSGRSKPGFENITVSGERVFFGEDSNPGNMYTWKNGVLSTIVSGQQNPGVSDNITSNDTERVFFGEYGSGSAAVWSWKNNVLSTIITNGYSSSQNAITATDSGDTVFLGEWKWPSASTRSWVWNPSTGLSTIGITGNLIGSDTAKFDTTGRLYVSDRTSAGPSKVWTWKNNVLSTIISNTYQWIGGGNRDEPALLPSGHIAFSQSHGGAGGFYLYKDNVLSTLILPGTSGAHDPGYFSTEITPDGRIFMGEGNPCCGPLRWRTWKDGVMSTLLSHTSTGFDAMSTMGPDGRVYYGSEGTSAGNGLYFTWKDGVMTTIVSGVTNPGHDNTSHIPGAEKHDARNSYQTTDNGTVFFSEDANPGKVWAWSPPIECNRNY